jgi:hypothetical protein
LRLFVNFQNTLSDAADYYGFLEPFKQLNREEKKVIRDTLNKTLETHFSDVTREQVQPCLIYRTENNTTIYTATIANIFFEDGMLSLRMKDDKYTDKYESPLITSGFNQIPLQHELATIEIEVSVSEHAIISHIDGLDIIINKIYYHDIQHILSRIDRFGTEKESEIDYAHDIQLKKNIINYLLQKQLKNTEPKTVFEYAGEYDRIKDSSQEIETNRRYLCHLYSIKVDDGIAIIWENVELDEKSATFVFKTKLEQHDRQLKRLSEAVSSYKNLRSYLISTLGLL